MRNDLVAYYESENCSGDMMLPGNFPVWDTWSFPSFIAPTNASGTRGTLYYPTADGEMRLIKSAKILGHGQDPPCQKSEPAAETYVFPHYKTININPWKLEPPFRLVDR